MPRPCPGNLLAQLGVRDRLLPAVLPDEDDRNVAVLTARPITAAIIYLLGVWAGLFPGPPAGRRAGVAVLPRSAILIGAVALARSTQARPKPSWRARIGFARR